MVAPLSRVEKLFRITPMEFPPNVRKPKVMIKQLMTMVDRNPAIETRLKDLRAADCLLGKFPGVSKQSVASSSSPSDSSSFSRREWYKSGAVKWPLHRNIKNVCLNETFIDDTINRQKNPNQFTYKYADAAIPNKIREEGLRNPLFMV